MVARVLYLRVVLSFFAFVTPFSGCSGGNEVKAPAKVIAPGNGVKKHTIPAAERSLQDVLSGLEKVPAPSGVDDGLFKELKNELSRALTQRSVEKFVSKPPSGDSGRVIDLVPTDNRDGTYSLSWSYRNMGDYNQDGMVDVADIVPLAETLFQPISPSNEWIDGNRDGVIDLSDIEPIANAFFSEVSAYLIEVAGIESEYSAFAQVSISDAGYTIEGRKFFTYTFAGEDASGFAFARVTPLDRTSAPGQESDSVGIAPPVVILDVTPSSGDVPLTVTFDASGSYDPDGGTIAKYEWDFDGDGVYDLVSESQSVNSKEYESPGVFSPSLRLVDDEGFELATISEVKAYASEWIHTWTKAYSGQQAVSASGESLAVDHQGNVYAVGSVNFPPDDPLADYRHDALILKHDAGGDLLWAKRWGGAIGEGGGGGEDFFHAVAVDGTGNVYIAGGTDSFWGTDSYAPCAAIVKLNEDGQLAWSKVIGVPESEIGSSKMDARDISVDSLGDVLVSGVASGFSQNDQGDVFVIKFDTNGNILWQRSWGAPQVDDGYNDVALDGANNLYVTGTTKEVTGEWIIFLLKYDVNGNLLLEKTFDVPESGEVWSRLAFGPDGNLLVAGQILNSATRGIDLLVFSLDSELNLLWGKIWGIADDEYPNAIAVDPEGNIFIAGDTINYSNPDLQKAFLVKFGGDGELLLQKTWGDGSRFTSFTDLAITSTGKLLITGTARNAYDPMWQDADGAVTDVVGAFGVPNFGRESYIEGGTVELVADADFAWIEGVMDIGGGDKSSLIMKIDPSEL